MDPSAALEVGENIRQGAGIAAYTLFIMWAVTAGALLLLWRAYQKLVEHQQILIEGKTKADLELAAALTKLAERIGFLTSLRS